MVKLRVQQFTAESKHHACQTIGVPIATIADCVLTDCLYPFVLRNVATYLRVKDETGNNWVDEVIVLSIHYLAYCFLLSYYTQCTIDPVICELYILLVMHGYQSRKG